MAFEGFQGSQCDLERNRRDFASHEKKDAKKKKVEAEKITHKKIVSLPIKFYFFLPFLFSSDVVPRHEKEQRPCQDVIRHGALGAHPLLRRRAPFPVAGVVVDVDSEMFALEGVELHPQRRREHEEASGREEGREERVERERADGEHVEDLEAVVAVVQVKIFFFEKEGEQRSDRPNDIDFFVVVLVLVFSCPKFQFSSTLNTSKESATHQDHAGRRSVREEAVDNLFFLWFCF